MKDSATSQHRPLYRDKRGPQTSRSVESGEAGARTLLCSLCALADICLEQVARISPASIDGNSSKTKYSRAYTHTASPYI